MIASLLFSILVPLSQIMALMAMVKSRPSFAFQAAAYALLPSLYLGAQPATYWLPLMFPLFYLAAGMLLQTGKKRAAFVLLPLPLTLTVVFLVVIYLSPRMQSWMGH
jgi:hypothetical protein